MDSSRLYRWARIVVPNGITFLTLMVLWLTLRSMQSQFAVLNQGYLEISPKIGVSSDAIQNAMRVGMDTQQSVRDDAPFQALDFSVDMTNVGNLPLKYKVVSYNIFINGESYPQEIVNEKSVGIIYPHQEKTFVVKSTYKDKLQHKPIPFSDIKKLTIKNVLTIEYVSSNSKDSTKHIRREFHWNIYNNTARLSWDRIEDDF